jgi:flagellar basal-body rod protein FlgG
MRALRTAATGMTAQQMNVEVISNNIANMNTVGFKKQRAEFQDLLYQNVERMGAQSSDTGTVVTTGVQIGMGVRTGSVYRIADQGNLQRTGGRYDLGIDGRGFFQVQLPSGETAYTRAGNFSIDDQGRLTTGDGYPVLPQLTIPQEATDVVISKNGAVQVMIDGNPAPQVVGELQLAMFFNEGGLESIGDNLLMETAASGPATVAAPDSPGFGQVVQGYVEASNVDAVSEITALIVAQRAYEMNSKVISTADQMLAAASNVRG